MFSKVDQKEVLIVEDQPLGLKIMKGLLEIEGFDVLEASDAESALKILNEKTPDLILIDMFLPDMNGLQLLDKIKEDKRLLSAKKVAISGMVTEGEVQKLMNSGFDHFISKPFGTKSFIEEIKLLITEMRKHSSKSL